MLQSTALKILKSGKNVFLTGSAGAGKTYILNKYIQSLRDHGVPVAITASTGIAATHIGGQTIHSWSGLGIKEEITDRDLEKIAKKKKVRERIENVRVLIIDEISMLSAQNLENINKILQYFKLNWLPFGGVQVIFSGDFFQLPPVSKERLPNFKKFAFMAHIWRRSDLHICYLTEQYRQSEDSLADFLNEIRSGEISDSGYDSLREAMENAQEKAECTVKLFTHNADVNLINAEELSKLETSPQFFFAEKSGTKTLIDSLQKSVLALDELVLKEGSQVIFVKNNFEEGYLNGTMGVVTGFTTDNWPIVETEDKEIVAKPVEWGIADDFGKIVASFVQVPLRLAWAITVHKSQGMTLDSAEMDLSKTFESGQGYVALSRVKSWSGLRLLGCNQTALQLDPLALKADKRFQELSAEAEEQISGKNDEYIDKSFAQFVLHNGGTMDPEAMKRNQQRLSLDSEKTEKVSTYFLTKKLIEAGKSLAQIVGERKMSEDTIIKHLEVLKKEHSDLDLSAFKPAEDRLIEMKDGFITAEETASSKDRDVEGRPKLKYVFELLNEKYFYRELKLARLFLD